MREKTLRKLITIAQACAISAAIGFAYAGASGSEVLPFRGAVAGFLVCLFVASFELLVVRGRLGMAITARPFIIFLLVKATGYVVLAMLALGVSSFLMGALPFAPAFSADAFTAGSTSVRDILFSLAISVVFTLTFSLNDLLGRGVLLNFLLGRYHRPREEDRIFLLIDLVGSTKAAEQLGNLRYHSFLNRFIQTVSPAILEQGGRIHAYVGDEIIAEWPAASGMRRGRCLRAVRDALELTRSCAPAFERDFGLAPRFRAILHMGPVVVGEMGGAKREIVFLGGTLNTASRMEAHAKAINETVVASRDLVEVLPVPPEARIRPLGDATLKDVARPVPLVAVDF
ncbi:MAG: adenylate/guanylate cyclase domain-containing protein [Alphaproteobacteria bacterium]